MWIDSHCHLDHEKLADAGRPEDIAAESLSSGVQGMLSINCRISDEFQKLYTLTETLENVWCTVGTHPHDACDPAEKSISADAIAEIVKTHPNVIGIGESGLDYYYNNSDPEDQKESFRKHIRACLEADVPLIVHARDADEDIAAILKEEGDGTNLKGIMHSFSSGRKLAEAALALDFHISFSGMITFKKLEDLRAIASMVPRNRLLVETDAPFLAPVPHRGKTNTPAFVVHTGAKLAEIHQMSPEDMAAITTENFFNLFPKAKTA